MSIPRNHHFVSQVHIKGFFNKERNKIFLYDKKLKNHYFKKTTKSVFSERDLNAKVHQNGYLDYSFLERDLNTHFEKDFSKHLKTIETFVTTKKYSSAVNNALYYFARYGIIGEVRNPRYKKNIEDALHSVFSEMFGSITSPLQQEFEEAFKYKEQTKYINAVQYSAFADEMIKKMGLFVFLIHIPRDPSDYFLLPDFCAANSRAKINTYFNPDVEDIAYIGLPLTSRIYIDFYSSKLKCKLPDSNILLMSSEKVFHRNRTNFEFCERTVACIDENYLRKFISKINT